MGGVAGDKTRPVEGEIMHSTYPTGMVHPDAPCRGTLVPGTWSSQSGFGGASYATRGLAINTALAVPTGAVNLPRSWGALASVYLGHPAA